MYQTILIYINAFLCGPGVLFSALFCTSDSKLSKPTSAAFAAASSSAMRAVAATCQLTSRPDPDSALHGHYPMINPNIQRLPSWPHS